MKRDIYNGYIKNDIRSEVFCPSFGKREIRAVYNKCEYASVCVFTKRCVLADNRRTDAVNEKSDKRIRAWVNEMKRKHLPFDVSALYGGEARRRHYENEVYREKKKKSFSAPRGVAKKRKKER